MYVKVHEDNILPKERFQFMIRERNEIDYQDTEYDYGSIMHYPRNAFQLIGCTIDCDTITPTPDLNQVLGQQDGLSDTDVLQINRVLEYQDT